MIGGLEYFRIKARYLDLDFDGKKVSGDALLAKKKRLKLTPVTPPHTLWVLLEKCRVLIIFKCDTYALF